MSQSLVDAVLQQFCNFSKHHEQVPSCVHISPHVVARPAGLSNRREDYGPHAPGAGGRDNAVWPERPYPGPGGNIAWSAALA